MLKMGCSKADITPGFPCFLRGYASRTELTEQVEDPIEVGVIALEQGSTRQIILTVDSLATAEADCQSIRREIEQRFDIAPQNVVIACSHSHFAPEMCGFTISTGGGMPWGNYPADERFRNFWMARVMPAIEQALNDLEAVELLQSDVQVSCIAFNRRTVRKADGMVITNYTYPQDPENYDFTPIDTTLNIWKFMRGTHVKAVLARYGCHAVTGGINNNAVSADFPGAFRQAVLAKMGCPAFFMNGTAGDVVPIQRNGSSRKEIGEVLANAVKLAERTFQKAPDFQLKSAVATVKVAAPDLVGKSLEEVEKMYKSALDSVQGKLEHDGNFYVTARLYNMFKKWQSSEGELPLQVIQLGSKLLVCLPFDVLTDIGSRIVEVFPEVIVVSYSGGDNGYISLPEDAPKGGYETTSGTSLAPDTGIKFINAAIELIGQLKK